MDRHLHRTVLLISLLAAILLLALACPAGAASRAKPATRLAEKPAARRIVPFVEGSLGLPATDSDFSRYWAHSWGVAAGAELRIWNGASLVGQIARHAFAAQDPDRTTHAVDRATSYSYLFGFEVHSARPRLRSPYLRGLIGSAKVDRPEVVAGGAGLAVVTVPAVTGLHVMHLVGIGWDLRSPEIPIGLRAGVDWMSLSPVSRGVGYFAAHVGATF